MVANPDIFIEGIDVVIKRDLDKHKSILSRTQDELTAYRGSVSHLIKRRKYYSSLLKAGKYDGDSMQKSLDMLKVDLTHMSDKVKLTRDALAHHTLIVDTLTQQLEDYHQAALRRAANAS